MWKLTTKANGYIRFDKFQPKSRNVGTLIAGNCSIDIHSDTGDEVQDLR